jgi:proteasome accessory factor B
MTINELRKEMFVTRRTLYRDLEMIEDAGYRFEKVGGGGGDSKKWRFPTGLRRSLDKPYQEQELLSLYFCMNLLQPFRGTPLRDGLESVLQKIEATFTEEERVYFGDLLYTHLAKMPGLKNYRKHAQTVSALSKACLGRRKVEVVYQSGAEDHSKTYCFHPYCLAYYGGELYTIGFSELRQSIRTLRVDRIRTLKTLSSGFVRPAAFDPEDYLGRSFGMYSEGALTPVQIEFTNEAARTVSEKEWHPTQRLEQKNGKVTLRMSVQGLPEVARWVLYHSPNAAAIEPPELKKMIAEFAGQTALAHR